MPINKAVRGLANYLGLYRGGAVELESNPFLTPTYNVSPFLQPPEWDYNNGSAGAAPWSVVHTVPDGEIWHIHAMGCQCDLPNANDEIVVYPFFSPGINVAPYIEYALSPVSVRFTAGLASSQETAWSGKTFDNPLVLSGGNQVGFHITKQVSTGNLTLNSACQFTRIRA